METLRKTSQRPQRQGKRDQRRKPAKRERGDFRLDFPKFEGVELILEPSQRRARTCVHLLYFLSGVFFTFIQQIGL